MSGTTTDPGTVSRSARRLLAGGPDLTTHLAVHGPMPVPAPWMLDEIGRAAVDGRGGAGFPLADKVAATLRATPRRGGRRPVVIANGTEGEPASRKDAVLLGTAPHLVLDGLVLVAGLVGAEDAVLVTQPAAVPGLRRAVADRRDVVRVEVRSTAHDRFVAGEAGALAAAVAGAPGLPGDRVVRLAERGPTGRPTLVANVETLAVAALVVRSGAPRHRSLGSPSAPGTRLVTVSDVRDPSSAEVLEIAGGTRLVEVIRASRQAVGSTRAVLVGGWGGVWVPRAALDTPVDRDGLAPWGAGPGAGVLAVLDDRTCPLGVTATIAAQLSDGRAGRCGPCVNGLPRIADVLATLARTRGGPAGLVAEVARVAALVDGRGACHHPDGVARMVRSALAVHRADVEAHLAGSCVAGGGR